MVRFIVSVIGGASLGGVYTLVALSTVLAYRATSTFNFAHRHFMLLPAFLAGAWTTSHSAPFAVTVFVAIGLNAAIGAVFYLVVLQRTTGLPIFMGVIATMGLASMLNGVMLLAFPAGQYHLDFPGLPKGATRILGARVETTSLWLAGFTLLLALLVTVGLQYTALGRRVRVAGQNPILASQSGINVRLLHLGSWALTGTLAGVAGIAYGSNHLVDSTLLTLALAAFPAILIGGLDSIPGAMVGGLLIGVFQGFVATYLNPDLLEVTTWVLLLFVLLVMPQGLFGTRQAARL